MTRVRRSIEKGDHLKLITWNIASLKALLSGKSKRAIQSQAVLQKIIKMGPDILGFQEVKLPPEGPSAKEQQRLKQLFPDYQIVWRASQKPARTSYAGTMMLYRNQLHPRVLRPNIDSHGGLDNEGRLLVLEFAGYNVINAYIPHYEYHQLRLHQRWLKELMAYLQELGRRQPVMVAGDLGILLPKTTHKSSMSKKTIATFTKQYQDFQKDNFVDAYEAAPNGNSPATWWAPNIAKQPDRGIQTDFWFVSSQFRDRIIRSGPLDTGARRDHAPIELEIDLAE